MTDHAELLPYRGDLIRSIEETQLRSVKLRATRKDVNDLLRRYNEFVSGVRIDIFRDPSPS